MGLDIALGVMILLGAIRGWSRGFVLQAIQLTGLIGGAYAAGPIRDYARPHVTPFLTSVPPVALDRMLWWASATVFYVATVTLGGALAKARRKRPIGEPEPDRVDQFGGMLLSAAKAAVIAAFLVGTFDKNAPTWVKQVPWVAEQLKDSRAMVVQVQYRPSDRIWSASPVQNLVALVRKNGIASPDDKAQGPEGEAEAPSTATTAEPRPVETASRPPRLDLPQIEAGGLDPDSPDFLRKFDEQFRKDDSGSSKPR